MSCGIVVRRVGRLAAIFAVLFIPAQIVAIGLPVEVSQASAHTCGSDYCSGSDSATQNNAQDNADQFYNGEVGYYYQDLTGGNPSNKQCPYDPGGYCFNTSAANGAISRFNAGTGLGVEFYYFGGGADSSIAHNYSSPFCFGWDQAADAVAHITNPSLFANYEDNDAVFIFLDIEQNNNFGWSNTTQAANRQVFDGFYDNLFGEANTNHCAGEQLAFQPGVYSSPDQWSYSFGSGLNAQITGTPIITTEMCCSATFPSGFTGAQWFGSSSYKDGYQFDENPDYDSFYEGFGGGVDGPTAPGCACLWSSGRS